MIGHACFRVSEFVGLRPRGRQSSSQVQALIKAPSQLDLSYLELEEYLVGLTWLNTKRLFIVVVHGIGFVAAADRVHDLDKIGDLGVQLQPQATYCRVLVLCLTREFAD